MHLSRNAIAAAAASVTCVAGDAAAALTFALSGVGVARLIVFGILFRLICCLLCSVLLCLLLCCFLTRAQWLRGARVDHREHQIELLLAFLVGGDALVILLGIVALGLDHVA